MIQPLAYVHPQAKVANNVIIDPFVTIEKNVEIGEGSWIGHHATIMEGARIGKNCRIFPGAVISAIPQDLKFDGEDTTVEIGNNTTIREFVTVNRGTKASYKTVIGNNVILANAATLAGHIEIHDFAIIGGLAAVHQFVKIGAHSMISGGGMARKDIPPFTKAAREPLSYVGVNSIGLRRRGFSNEQINQIQEIYRIIYLKNYNVSQAINIIEADVPATPERDEILTFVASSTRGIMKGYTSLYNNGKD